MFRRVVVVAAFAGIGVVLMGCAGAKVRGPTDEELISQVMYEWKAGWEGKNVERIMACISPNFATSDGDGPDAIREFATGFAERAETKIEMVMDEIEISVQEETASVRGIHGTMIFRDREGQQRKGRFGSSVGLRKEEGKWLITWTDVWSLDE